MPRNPCLFVPRATCHFCCRVARGEYVLDSDEEAIESVDVLRRVRNQDGLTILAWLNAGLKREREDDGFIRRLDTLDHAISRNEADNAPMRSVAP